ncbi:EF-hand domain-containing protein [Sphingobium yanoikuyae]|uniref:EF-hand domain-containing protein n=1 Tax=Sphingobium yanoikuyae TaxID=13690 RepID=UPI0028B1B494|nr:EF-hand domain-containing protein [Sphingobium yanoikuyae]
MLRKFFATVAVGSLFVGGLAATHVAFAQDGGPGPRGMRGGPMMMADANNDGTITKAELTASLEARFAKLDANKDGKLTKEDRDIRRQQRLDERFAALDTDKNGQISKAEFQAGHQPRADRGPEAGKPGGPDGKRWGGRGHGGPGRGMMHRGPGFGDADKDGTMTKAEFMAGPLAMFDKADANKDGKVTAEEMKAARQAMRGPGRGHDRGPGRGPGADQAPPPPAN